MVETILAAVAEAERLRIMERTKEGQEEAKARGVKFGPKVKVDRQKVRRQKQSGLTASEIAVIMKIRRSIVYKILSQQQLSH